MFKEWLKEFILMILRTFFVFICAGAIFFVMALGAHLMCLSLWIGFAYIGIIVLVGVGLAAYFEIKDK